MEQPHTFLFFGRSGAGKGTQAKLLISHLEQNDTDRKVLYIETGGRFREFLKRGCYTSKLVEKTFKEGGLLPAFLPIWLWTDCFIESFTGEEHLILDGLSRRKTEAPILYKALSFYGRQNPFVVYVDTSRKWSAERLKERGRADDTDEEIEKRLDWYDKNVMPAVEYFRDETESTFITVNGEQSVEDVHQEVLRKTGLSS